MHKDIEEEILELTKKLIRIPSTHSRPEEILRCADFIEEWLGQFSIDYTRHDSAGTPSIAVMPKTDNPRVLLVSHFDVVEAEAETLFEPRLENDNLFGRGAIDDKYAVALSLVLFKEHLNTLRQSGLDQGDMMFGLLLTGDEEVGGANGTGLLSNTIRPDFFIVLDGGSPSLMVTKEKGIILLHMESLGKSAHAARPWLGENSFDTLVNDYLKIKEVFATTSADHWHKTMVLSQCKAGNGSTNMVPKNSSATLDIRYTELDDPDEIIAAIRKAANSTITVKAKEPLFFSGSSPYLDLLKNYAAESGFGFEHGASDARYFSKKGIPGVIWGANGEMSQHTEDEHVVIDTIFSLYDRLDGFVTALNKSNTVTESGSVFHNFPN